MSLPQMRTFIEVYRRRSLSDAARALGITQPAASQHIASLEAQLGHPLFAFAAPIGGVGLIASWLLLALGAWLGWRR